LKTTEKPKIKGRMGVKMREMLGVEKESEGAY